MYDFEDIKNADNENRVEIINTITNRDYIRQNIIVCLQKLGDNEPDLIRERYLNLEAYLRVKVGEDVNMKILFGERRYCCFQMFLARYAKRKDGKDVS